MPAQSHDDAAFWAALRREFLRISQAKTLDEVKPAAKAIALLIEQRGTTKPT